MNKEQGSAKKFFDNLGGIMLANSVKFYYGRTSSCVAITVGRITHSSIFDFSAALQNTVRTGHGTTDWFQIGKGIRQAVYCHPAYLTYMQSTL